MITRKLPKKKKYISQQAFQVKSHRTLKQVLKLSFSTLTKAFLYRKKTVDLMFEIMSETLIFQFTVNNINAIYGYLQIISLILHLCNIHVYASFIRTTKKCFSVFLLLNVQIYTILNRVDK